jgi:hypothetical protein
MIFYLFFGAFGSDNNMNDEISSNINDADLSDQFRQSLANLYSLVEKDDTSAAIASLAPEVIAAGIDLQKSFDRLLQSADPAAGYQIRSSLTEIHRLLRILNRDLLFWQGAKQSRSVRRAQVLATLQSIEGFYQFLQ